MRLPIKKTRSSSHRKPSPFDFTEDDERVEITERKILSKFYPEKPKKPKTSFLSPVDKYKFLQFFSKRPGNGQNNSRSAMLHIDEIDDKVEERILSSNVSVSSEPKSCFWRRSECSVDHVSLDGDDDQSIELQLSTSASNLVLCEGMSEDDLLEVGSSSCDTEKMVVINPDYIIYEKMYSNKSLLTFTSQGIKLEGADYFGIRKSFSFSWAISEIVSIESVWCESAKLAEMCLCFKSKDMKVADIANKSQGVVKLNFAVSDSHWSEREEMIKSLDWRYKAAWNSVVDIDTLKTEEGSLSQNSLPYLQHNYPNDPAKVVVYPEGDPDAVTLSKRDIQLLQPKTFINDTIIDFYIKHLECRIKPMDRKRFYFFNSFFFRKLADLDKDPSKADEGRVAFKRVRKWTRNLNLFEKDFIFVPVNFSLHWSLIVICHPGEVVTFRDEEREKSSNEPCILHMDSIRGSHRGLKNLFRSYLGEEWKNRHDEAAEDLSERFLKLPFISLQLPQQENSFDCGLFLLHYVELFLENALVGFNPFNLMQSSSFLQKDWFPPAKASEKRAHIRKLMCEIFGDNHHENNMVASDGKYPVRVTERNICSGFLQEICGPTEVYSSENLKFDSDQEVQITSVATPSCSRKPIYMFGDSLWPEKFGKSVANGNLQQEAGMVAVKLASILSPIEEEREYGKQGSRSQTEKAQCQRVVDTGELSTRHQASRLTPMPTECLPKNLLNLKEYDPGPIVSPSGISTSQPQAWGEAQHDGDSVPVIFVVPSPEEANYVLDSSSMPSKDFEHYVIEDSEEDGPDSLRASPSSCKARTPVLSLEEVESSNKSRIRISPGDSSCSSDCKVTQIRNVQRDSGSSDCKVTQIRNFTRDSGGSSDCIVTRIRKIDRKQSTQMSRCSVQQDGRQGRKLFEDSN